MLPNRGLIVLIALCAFGAIKASLLRGTEHQNFREKLFPGRYNVSSHPRNSSLPGNNNSTGNWNSTRPGHRYQRHYLTPIWSLPGIPPRNSSGNYSSGHWNLTRPEYRHPRHLSNNTHHLGLNNPNWNHTGQWHKPGFYPTNNTTGRFNSTVNWNSNKVNRRAPRQVFNSTQWNVPGYRPANISSNYGQPPRSPVYNKHPAYNWTPPANGSLYRPANPAYRPANPGYRPANNSWSRPANNSRPYFG